MKFSEGKNLKKFSKKSSWVIEGAHAGEWILPGLKRAEVIFLLNLSKRKLLCQIIKRHKERLKTNSDNLLGLLKLLWWAIRDTLSEYMKYKNLDIPFLILSNTKEVSNMLNSLK